MLFIFLLSIDVIILLGADCEGFSFQTTTVSLSGLLLFCAQIFAVLGVYKFGLYLPDLFSTY